MHGLAAATAAPRAAAACSVHGASAAATHALRSCAAPAPLRAAAAVRRRSRALRLRAAADGAPPPPPPPQEPLRDPLGAAKFDATAAMVDDIARLRVKRAAEKAAEAEAAGGAVAEPAQQAEWEKALNAFLVFDFFFVLAAGAFLVAGVVEQTSSKGESKVLADLFFKAWPVLVQPALGVLMLASIVSGAAGWAREKGILK